MTIIVIPTVNIPRYVFPSVSRKNCYMVSAGDLQNRYSQREESGKRMTPGLLIGCHLDTSTGLLSFTVNGQEVANKFQVRTAPGDKFMKVLIAGKATQLKFI